MTTLMRANWEWSSRAADERFSSIEDMHKKALQMRHQARTADAQVRDLRVVAEDDDLRLVGETGTRADLTHWSLGQLAGIARAPASYIRTLPPQVAADCLNHGLRLAAEAEDGESDEDARRVRLLLDKNGHLRLRAINSEQYARIWNVDVLARIIELKTLGPWQEAPAAFDESRGQYMSDRDMFSFFVDSDRRIFETANGGLSRGFFVWNSEVGAASFGVMTFLYEFVCGNHRVWGASNVQELRLRHVGEAGSQWIGEMQARLTEYADASAEEDETKIKAAREFSLGLDRDEVVDAVFKVLAGKVSRRTIIKAHDLAEEHSEWYGDPRSAWGMSGGLTEIARDLPNADERVALDRASTRVTKMAF